jgi:hypothetical protein
MTYTMNGMAIQLRLQADRPGVYYGQSSMFSGDRFSDMHFSYVRYAMLNTRSGKCAHTGSRSRSTGVAPTPRLQGDSPTSTECWPVIIEP